MKAKNESSNRDTKQHFINGFFRKPRGEGAILRKAPKATVKKATETAKSISAEEKSLSRMRSRE